MWYYTNIITLSISTANQPNEAYQKNSISRKYSTLAQTKIHYKNQIKNNYNLNLYFLNS